MPAKQTISACRDRTTCTVEARIVSLTYSAHSQTPKVKATLRDSTGSLLVTWLGRKTIGGLTVGQEIQVTGMVALGSGHPQMINPRYQLLTSGYSET